MSTLLQTTGKPTRQTHGIKATLIAAYKAAVLKARQLTFNNPRREALRKLFEGSVVGSEVTGVNSPEAVLELIQNLGEIHLTWKYPDGKWAFRFPLPSGYTGLTPTAQIKDLKLDPIKDKDKVQLYQVYQHKGVVYGWHAPKLRPIPAEQVTFLLSPDEQLLLEWFAGEDIYCVPATSDPGTAWVHLGRDMYREYQRTQQR